MALRDYLSHYTPKQTPAYEADVTLRVGPDALTFAQALDALQASRAAHPEQSVTIRVAPGEYRTAGLTFTAEMSGTEAAPVTMVAEGKPCVLNGGVSLSPADFVPVEGDFKARLHGDAPQKVLVADLKKYGLTADDFGPLAPYGSCQTGRKYDGVCLDPSCEIFMNNRRMTLARWPNKGTYAKLEAVADVGDCGEFPPQNYYRDWDTRRNQRGGTYIISRADNARVSTWKSHDDVWAFGYFFWDWADSSTPVTFDLEHRRFFPKFVSYYAARAGAEFFFYNVPDELDEPGEYYLDRKNSLLYVYPYDDTDVTDMRVEISIGKQPAIRIDGAEYLTLDGFSVCNVRADGITINGNHIDVRDCTVYNVADFGIKGEGTAVTVRECEISHTGRGGITLTGGDRPTLTPGHCVVDNNFIHDFAEIYQTYAGGIHIGGVGNVCAHNEITNTPHAALFYYGNDLLIEYNYIHDVVKHSRDAGAIYSGQDWTQQGTILRYNVLENVGTEEFHPEGIYWDDGLSNQTAYANFLIHVGHNGIMSGGGFDQTVRHNIVVDTERPLQYDERNRDGLVRSGWCHADVDTREGRSWKYLDSMPIHSDVWKQRYPLLDAVRDDVDNRESWDDPHMPTNPAFSTVTENVIIARPDSRNDISEGAMRFSKIENNPEIPMSEDAGFVNAADGDYRLRPDGKIKALLPDFPDIPFEKIGRY